MAGRVRERFAWTNRELLLFPHGHHLLGNWRRERQKHINKLFINPLNSLWRPSCFFRLLVTVLPSHNSAWTTYWMILHSLHYFKSKNVRACSIYKPTQSAILNRHIQEGEKNWETKWLQMPPYDKGSLNGLMITEMMRIIRPHSHRISTQSNTCGWFWANGALHQHHQNTKWVEYLLEEQPSAVH